MSSRQLVMAVSVMTLLLSSLLLQVAAQSTRASSDSASSTSMTPKETPSSRDFPNFNKTLILENLGFFSVGSSFANNKCEPKIEAVMTQASEYSKLGMSAAITLLTLIPTLLTFGNLFVPKSSESFGTSFFIGIFTSAFGLGLPVQSISGVPRANVIDLARMPPHDVDRLREYGRALRGSFKVRDIPSIVAPLAELHAWFSAQHGTLVKHSITVRPWQFRNLKYRVHRSELRNHTWYLPALFIGFIQIFLFLIVMFPTVLVTPSQPFWSCHDGSVDATNGTSDIASATPYWLLVSAGVAIAIKTLQWEASHHELVKIHPLPGLLALQSLVDDPAAETTSAHLPPNFRIFRPIRWLVHATHSLIARTLFVFTHPVQAARAEQSRRKPLVILVHLNAGSRNPIATIFTGFIQSATLLILTFFFGSYWAGNLVNTLAVMTILLVTVTAGRLCGLIYIRWSAHAYGFTLIECYDKQEIRGVVRVLASMPDVMVEVNSAKYVWGVRVDDHPEFRQYLLEVEKGKHDSVRFGSGIPLDDSELELDSKMMTNESLHGDEAPTQQSTPGKSSPMMTTTADNVALDKRTPPPSVSRATDSRTSRLDAAPPHTQTWSLTGQQTTEDDNITVRRY